MKRFVLTIFISFLGLFALLELSSLLLLSKIEKRNFESFNDYLKPKDFSDADYVFMGSSRVASAIVPKVFESKGIKVKNCGRGNSGPRYHYIALKQMLQQNPKLLQNAAVVLEAPSGLTTFNHLPNYVLTDPQNFDQSLRLIYKNLPAKLFMAYLFGSGLTFSQQVQSVLYFYSSFFRKVDYVRTLINKYKARTFDLAAKKEKLDITTRGGINNDASVKEILKQKAENDTLLPITKNWNKSVINDFYELGKQYNFEVMVLYMPEFESYKYKYQTQIGKQQLANFKSYLNAKQIKMLKVEAMEFSHQDFPDYLHMGKSKSQLYSAALAQYMQNRR